MLEVTEATTWDRAETGLLALHALRRRGHRIAMDDFGTGYSALGQLRRLPVDEVKLDRSLLTALQDDARAGDLIDGVIGLCQRLRLPVIAEGVEDAAGLALLRNLGCDAVQGFYLHRPTQAHGVPLRSGLFAAGA